MKIIIRHREQRNLWSVHEQHYSAASGGRSRPHTTRQHRTDNSRNSLHKCAVATLTQRQEHEHTIFLQTP